MDLSHHSEFFEFKQIPNTVKSLFDLFAKSQFELYAVGGCIRNLLLQREPKDWDFATSATPTEMIDLFKKYQLRVIPTGVAFGTVTVVIDDDFFEITTYRIEGRYAGRSPLLVAYSRSLEADLERRDFTINALAWNPKQGLVDLFQGQKDLEDKLIRLIGSDDRFSEDPLRLMRAARLAAEINFEVEPATLEAMKKHADELCKVSIERITSELSRILLSPKPSIGLEILRTSGILGFLIPELKPTFQFDQNSRHHLYLLFQHLIHVTDAVPAKLSLRLAALLHDVGKPFTRTLDDAGEAHYYNHQKLSSEMASLMLNRFSFAKEDQSNAVILVREHMSLDDHIGKRGIKRLLNRLGTDGFEDLLQLVASDRGTYLSDLEVEMDEADPLIQIQQMYQELIRDQEPYEESHLAINGKDLIQLGMQPGKDIGDMKKELHHLVMDHPEYNTNAYLIDYVKQRLEEESYAAGIYKSSQ